MQSIELIKQFNAIIEQKKQWKKDVIRFIESIVCDNKDIIFAFDFDVYDVNDNYAGTCKSIRLIDENFIVLNCYGNSCGVIDELSEVSLARILNLIDKRQFI